MHIDYGKVGNNVVEDELKRQPYRIWHFIAVVISCEIDPMLCIHKDYKGKAQKKTENEDALPDQYLSALILEFFVEVFVNYVE